MRTVRWSELSAEYEVRYTVNEMFLIITMSRTRGVSEVFYGFLLGVRSKDQTVLAGRKT